MGHTSEEKINILYEDSLADIRDLTKRMEGVSTRIAAAADAVGRGQIILHKQNEALLTGHINDIKKAVDRLTSIETEAVNTAAASDVQITWLAKHQTALTTLETFIVTAIAFSGGLLYGSKDAGAGSILIDTLLLISGVVIGVGIRSVFLGRLDKTESITEFEDKKRKAKEHQDWGDGIAKIVKAELKANKK
jgi:hypothetical protein